MCALFTIISKLKGVKMLQSFDRFTIPLHIGAIASADTGIVAQGFCPLKGKVKEIRVKDSTAFTASASVENSLDLIYIDPDGASATFGTINFVPTASAGTDDLGAGVSVGVANVGVDIIEAYEIIPANSDIRAEMTKLGNGNSMTFVSVDVICEPWSD